jgi:hypothetical protein
MKTINTASGLLSTVAVDADAEGHWFKVESCIRSFIKHNFPFLYKMYLTNLLY